MLSRLRERVARFLAHRQDDWPNLVMAEFQWTSGLGLTEVTVERYLTGSSVRFAGSGFGLLVAEEVEANLGVYGYLSRRGDESDAQSVAWVLRRYLPERPRDRT